MRFCESCNFIAWVVLMKSDIIRSIIFMIKLRIDLFEMYKDISKSLYRWPEGSLFPNLTSVMSVVSVGVRIELCVLCYLRLGDQSPVHLIHKDMGMCFYNWAKSDDGESQPKSHQLVAQIICMNQSAKQHEVCLKLRSDGVNVMVLETDPRLCEIANPVFTTDT